MEYCTVRKCESAVFMFSSTDQPNEQWSKIKLAQFSAAQAFSAWMSPAMFFWPMRNLTLRTIKFCEPPRFTLLRVITMPSPGAVWPASVQSERFTRSSLARAMSPLTANTMVMGSPLCCPKAQRSVPSPPSSASEVTVTTLPPRPPEAYLPNPSAVGNASTCVASAALTAGESTPLSEMARTLYEPMASGLMMRASVVTAVNTPSLYIM